LRDSLPAARVVFAIDSAGAVTRWVSVLSARSKSLLPAYEIVSSCSPPGSAPTFNAAEPLVSGACATIRPSLLAYSVPSTVTDGCTAAMTCTLIVTATPAGDGFIGESTVRVVTALPTVREASAIAALNAASPEYDASATCAPA